MEAKRRVRDALADLAVLAEASAGAREMLDGAETERGNAADDFERDSEPGAAARYIASVENLRARRATRDGARLAVAEARKLLKAAQREREAADEDLIAIAQGRRDGA